MSSPRRFKSPERWRRRCLWATTGSGRGRKAWKILIRRKLTSRSRRTQATTLGRRRRRQRCFSFQCRLRQHLRLSPPRSMMTHHVANWRRVVFSKSPDADDSDNDDKLGRAGRHARSKERRNMRTPETNRQNNNSNTRNNKTTTKGSSQLKANSLFVKFTIE